MKKVLLILALMVGCKTAERTNVFVTESGIEYKVRIEFVVPIEYKTKYPFISRALHNAVDRWSEVVPIDPIFLPMRVHGRRAIQVLIVPGGVKYAPLGTYQRSMRHLFLNSTKLTTYSDAYDVALHEIGHAFGLHHVGNVDDIGRGAITTGMIIVLNQNAEEQLMCPFLTETNKQVGISDLDIELVRLYIRNELSW